MSSVVRVVTAREQEHFFIPRRENPFDPSQVIPAACIGLVIIFSSAVLRAAATKTGAGIGDGIKPFIAFCHFAIRTISESSMSSC